MIRLALLIVGLLVIGNTVYTKLITPLAAGRQPTDEEVIESIRAEGANLPASLMMRCLIDVSSEDEANKAVAVLIAEHFDAKVSHFGSLNQWSLSASRPILPTASGIAEVRQQLTAVRGGDGWTSTGYVCWGCTLSNQVLRLTGNQHWAFRNLGFGQAGKWSDSAWEIALLLLGSVFAHALYEVHEGQKNHPEAKRRFPWIVLWGCIWGCAALFFGLPAYVIGMLVACSLGAFSCVDHSFPQDKVAQVAVILAIFIVVAVVVHISLIATSWRRRGS